MIINPPVPLPHDFERKNPPWPAQIYPECFSSQHYIRLFNKTCKRKLSDKRIFNGFLFSAIYLVCETSRFTNDVTFATERALEVCCVSYIVQGQDLQDRISLNDGDILQTLEAVRQNSLDQLVRKINHCRRCKVVASHGDLLTGSKAGHGDGAFFGAVGNPSGDVEHAAEEEAVKIERLHFGARIGCRERRRAVSSLLFDGRQDDVWRLRRN